MVERKWVKKFIKLCSRFNTRDFGKAIKLKDARMPTKLYQYRSINTLDNPERLNWILEVIKTGKLFCSSNADLNDPLDLQSILSSNHASTYIESIASAAGDRNIASTYHAIKFLTPFFKWRWKKDGLSSEEIAAFDTSINDIVMTWTEDLQAQHSDLLDVARIVCFTEKHDNLPMWWFYADERRGLCLEFDVSELSITDKMFIFPVNYTCKLFDAVEVVHRYDEKRIKNLSTDARDFFALLYSCILPCTHKLLDWSYESEWRYVMVNQDFFEFVKPKKIILGDKIDVVKEKIILDTADVLNTAVSKMKITKYGFQEDTLILPT